jgi:hypothetical protein
MKNKILPILIGLFFTINVFSQTTTTTINYLTSGISTSTCNVFNPPLNVTTDVNGTASALLHSSYAGGVSFNTTYGLLLSTTPQANPPGGTACRINYSFTPGNTYTIAITALGNPAMLLKTSVVPNFNQFPTNGTSSCIPDAYVTSYQTVGVGQMSTATTTSSATYNVSQFSVPGNSVYPYLIIWASGGRSNLSLDNLSISKIIITETVPVCNSIPSGLSTSNNTTILNWNAISGISSYKVTVTDTYNGVPTTTVLYSNTNSLKFCAQAIGDNVSFYVQSICSNGAVSQASNSYSYTFNPPTLSTPTGILYNNTTDLLTWNAVPNATGYNIQLIDITAGSGTSIINVTTNSATRYQLNPALGHTYQVSINAYDCFGSSYSSWYTFTVQTPCNPPSVSSIIPLGNKNLQINFSPPTTGQTVTDYNIRLDQYSPTSGNTFYYSVGTTNPITITVPVSGGTYIVNMQSVCGANTSTFVSCCGSPTFVWGNHIGNLTTEINGDSPNQDSFKLYPSPASDNVILSVTTIRAGKGNILVVNAIGDIVMKKSISLSVGRNSFTLSGIELPNGVYNVKLIQGDKAITQKLIIQK